MTRHNWERRRIVKVDCSKHLSLKKWSVSREQFHAETSESECTIDWNTKAEHKSVVKQRQIKKYFFVKVICATFLKKGVFQLPRGNLVKLSPNCWPILNVPAAYTEFQKSSNRQHQNFEEETLCTPDNHVQNRQSQQQSNKRAIAQDGQVLSTSLVCRHEWASPQLLNELSPLCGGSYCCKQHTSLVL